MSQYVFLCFVYVRRSTFLFFSQTCIFIMKGQKMKGVKKADDKLAEAARAAHAARVQVFNGNGGLLDWTPEQHFSYWEIVLDKVAEAEAAEVACEPLVVLPTKDNDVIIVD